MGLGKTVAFGQPGHVVDDHRAPRLDAAVVAVDGLGAIVRDGRGIVEPQAHVVVQRRLVALQRQDVVATALQDGLRGGALAVHRVGGDDPALERQERQQLGQGPDLPMVGGLGLSPSTLR